MTDSGDDVAPTRRRQALVDAATTHYVAYVRDQADQLSPAPRRSPTAYTAGDDDKAASALRRHARALGADRAGGRVVRRPRPGDRPREADLEAGQKWTGWHRIEKDLWPGAEPTAATTPLTPEQRALRRRPACRTPSTLLHADPATSRSPPTRSPTAPRACSTRSPPARSPARRSTGRTPTCGTSRPTSTAPASPSRACGRCCRPQRRPRSMSTRPRVHRSADRCSTQHEDGDGFVPYDELSPSRSRQLSDAVNALSEPLSKLTAAVIVTSAAEPDVRSRPADADAASACRGAAVRRRLPARVLGRRRRGVGRRARRRPRRRRAGPRGTRRRASRRRRPTPSTATHQAGIVTPAQDRLHFAAFDVTTDVRDELVELLRHWTDDRRADDARAWPPGPFGPASGPYDAPPDDTGEAVGLPPAGLTITFGFGPSLFVGPADGTRTGSGSPTGRPTASSTLPHFAGRRPRPGPQRRRPVRAGLRRRPAGGRARHPQPVPDRVRHARRSAGPSSASAARRRRQHRADHAAQPVRVQGRHRERQGRGDRRRSSEHVWVPAARTPTAAGWPAARYLVARRIRMRIETWDRTSLREQEDARSAAPRARARRCPAAPSSPSPTSPLQGRGGKPLIAVDSHVRLAHPDHNDGVRMLRRGYNFIDGNDGARSAGRRAVLPRVRARPAHALHPDADEAVARRRADGVPHSTPGPALFAVPPGVPDGSLVTGPDGTPGDHGRQPVRRGSSCSPDPRG